MTSTSLTLPLAIASLVLLQTPFTQAADDAYAEQMVKHIKEAEDLTVNHTKVSPTGTPFLLEKAAAIPSLADGGFASSPAFQDDFSAGWESEQKDWRIATWKQNGTTMAKERSQTDGEGHMVQTVLGGMPPRGGSMQTKREFGYGRWVARVKAAPVPGVLNSIFTKDWDDMTTPDDEHDGKKGEVDIELISHSYGDKSGEAHLAIHLEKHTPLWHVDIPVDFNPSDEFHEWGFDILPDRVVWHVDGKLLFAWKYTEDFNITEGYEFFFNSWFDKKWIQGPPEKDTSYTIDWVKFYPLEKRPSAQ